jgi:hypothetical protein
LAGGFLAAVTFLVVPFILCTTMVTYYDLIQLSSHQLNVLFLLYKSAKTDSGPRNSGGPLALGSNRTYQSNKAYVINSKNFNMVYLIEIFIDYMLYLIV